MKRSLYVLALLLTLGCGNRNRGYLNHFGETGGVSVTVGNYADDKGDWLRKVFPLSDGSVIVAGTSYFQDLTDCETDPFSENPICNPRKDGVVIKFNKKAELDKEFQGGKVIIDNGFEDNILDAARQSSGKIVLLIRTVDRAHANPNTYLIRLHPDGSQDKTFGNGGRATVHAEVEEAENQFVALDSSDTIYVASDFYPNVAVWHYDRSGKLDTNFAGSGRAFLPYNLTAEAFHVTPKDRVLITGRTKDNRSMIMFALNAEGDIDTTFAENGIADFTSNENAQLHIMALASTSDRIVVASKSTAGGKPFSTLVMFNDRGQRIPGFASNGEMRFYDHTELIDQVQFDTEGNLIVQAKIDVSTYFRKLNKFGQTLKFGTDNPWTYIGRSNRKLHMVVDSTNHIYVGRSDRAYAISRYSEDGLIDARD